jgi:hypothetical protein
LRARVLDGGQREDDGRSGQEDHVSYFHFFYYLIWFYLCLSPKGNPCSGGLKLNTPLGGFDYRIDLGNENGGDHLPFCTKIAYLASLTNKREK